MTHDQALAQVDNLTQSQAVMTATDQMFRILAVVFVIAALVVWLAPKPKPAGQPHGRRRGLDANAPYEQPFSFAFLWPSTTRSSQTKVFVLFADAKKNFGAVRAAMDSSRRPPQ